MGADYNVGAPSASGQQSMQDILKAYQQYIPSLIPEIAGTTPAVTQAQLLSANQLVNPSATQATQVGLPQLSSQSNLQQLTGTGAQSAGAAYALNQALSPTTTMANTQAQNALGAINLSGLSPGEANAIERSNNQGLTSTGNLGLNNPTNTISNAMNFGGAFNSKIPLLNNTIGTATNAGIAQSGTGVNPVSVALGTPNFGAGSFVNPNAGSSATGTSTGLGSSIMGNINSAFGGGQSSATQLEASKMAANAQGWSSMMGMCCFIFMEAYYGKMPLHIRRARNHYYNLSKDIDRGYRKMANWLVPIMQSSPFIRWLVWNTMIKPASIYTKNPKPGLRKKVCRFWLRLWAIMGGAYANS